MAEFQRRAGTALPKSFTMTVGSKLSLKLIPAKDEKLPLPIATADPEIAKVVGSEHRVKANFMIFSLEAVKLGSTSLSAGTDPVKPAAGPIAISVVAKIALPDETTTEGMFARLFLAECWAPSATGYSATDAETSMKWMKTVVQNRLARKSAIVGSAGARTLLDVVKAPNQFQGFKKYPALSGAIKTNLESYVRIANDDSHAERDAYRQFVETAIKVASMKVEDPELVNLLFWRTTGSDKPASTAVEYKELIGNTFYTLAP